jgi:hypothetical protein
MVIHGHVAKAATPLRKDRSGARKRGGHQETRSDLRAVIALEVNLGATERVGALGGRLRRIAALNEVTLAFARLFRRGRGRETQQRFRAALQPARRKTGMRREPGKCFAEWFGRTGVHR